MTTIEVFKDINISFFDQLVQNKCLDVEAPGSLSNVVSQQLNIVRRNLEHRAGGRDFTLIDIAERFERLEEQAVVVALELIQCDSNRVYGEAFYLEGLLGIKDHFAEPLFLGEIEQPMRKNPLVQIITADGKVVNDNAKVRLSSAMLLFGAIASAARISIRTSGEPEAWDSNLDIAVGMQYALNIAREGYSN